MAGPGPAWRCRTGGSPRGSGYRARRTSRAAGGTGGLQGEFDGRIGGRRRRSWVAEAAVGSAGGRLLPARGRCRGASRSGSRCAACDHAVADRPGSAVRPVGDDRRGPARHRPVGRHHCGATQPRIGDDQRFPADQRSAVGAGAPCGMPDVLGDRLGQAGQVVVRVEILMRGHLGVGVSSAPAMRCVMSSFTVSSDMTAPGVCTDRSRPGGRRPSVARLDD